MKGNVKRLAVLVIITVMATFILAATVTAESSKHGSIWSQFWSPIDITGQYAATGGGTAFAAPLGFDPNFQPNCIPGTDPEVCPYQLFTCTSESVFTFERDGTGYVETIGPCISHNPPPPYLPLRQLPFAANSTDFMEFTYEVRRDGSITLTQVPGSFVGCFTSGSEAFAADVGVYRHEGHNWRGNVSPDGKTIILSSGLDDKITQGVAELIVNMSRVLIWQRDIDYKHYHHKHKICGEVIHDK
jgi:hypothetical protein